MYDDDLYSSLLNGFGTTTTDTDEETESASSYNPSSYGTTTSYNPYSTDTDYQTNYKDDYSVTPNYEEQSSYESASRNEESETSQQAHVYGMHTPMIQREEQTVVLTKTKQKVYLHARMKIVIAMFITIVSALLFVSVFNFVNAGRLNASIAEKQIEINEIQASITSLRNEYNLLSDDGYIKETVTNPDGLNFVESTETNTIVFEVGDVYTEPVIEELPSNWFNDVCDFFSNLFAT